MKLAVQWFFYLCILCHWRIKIPKEARMQDVGGKDRSIDRSEDVFVEYPVCVISVAVIVLLLNDAHFFQSLLC